MGEAAAGHDAAQAGDSTAYDQWELRQLEAFAAAVGMDDAAERLAVARYLQLASHDNILLRCGCPREAGQPAAGQPAGQLLRETGKA